MRPRVAILGHYPGCTLRDLKIDPDLPTDPRIIAVRFDASLYYANVSYFKETILETVASNA